LQANAATCSAVQATDALPPANGQVVSTWDASGKRRWDCKNGTLVDPKQIAGSANFTSTDGAWTGGFYYIDKIARFDITNTKDGAKYSFNLDDKPGLTNVDGTLPDARWTVNWIGAGPAGLNAGEQYLVRTNSTGGVTPTKCGSRLSHRVEVPYTTKCKLSLLFFCYLYLMVNHL
jgi:hypothetical protein